jgi:hypothetical protein
MGKASDRAVTGGLRFAADAHRDRTGWEAKGTANLLESTDHAFKQMLIADDVNGLSDEEWRQIRKARKEVRNAAKRLKVISRRCIRSD